MNYWGITGTNGKTTTTWITAAFIDAMAGRKCGYVTTVEVFDGAKRFYTGYTTPPLAQLKEIFAAMEANGCTDCVMEVSSHAIHQHRTGDTVFAGGAFTNLSEDHLDYHKTMEAYFDVKLDFARQIAAAHPAAPDAGRRDLPPYVVCLDGGYGREMFNAVGNLAVNVIPVSIPTAAFDLSRLQLAGDYNRSNVLVAAALAEAAGVSHETIQAVIPTLKPRWGRLELIENPRVKAKVYVDFAHTPDGLEKVLTAVRGELGVGNRCRCTAEEELGVGNRCRCTAEGELGSAAQLRNNGDHHCTPTPIPYTYTNTSSPSLWVVFGAGGDRDPMKRPLMGEACARLADRLVITSDNPRSEDPMKIIDAIVKGVESVDRSTFNLQPSTSNLQPSTSNLQPSTSNLQPSTSNLQPSTSNLQPSTFFIVEPDRAKAIAYALSSAAEGDVIVIAGKGHETTQEIKGVKYPFDDREVVRRW